MAYEGAPNPLFSSLRRCYRSRQGRESRCSTPGRRLSPAGGGNEATARPDNQLVGGPQVLTAAVHDRAHAFGHRHVLLADALDARVAEPVFLRFAVDEEVILEVLGDIEAAVPVGRVRQVLA